MVSRRRSSRASADFPLQLRVAPAALRSFRDSLRGRRALAAEPPELRPDQLLGPGALAQVEDSQLGRLHPASGAGHGQDGAVPSGLELRQVEVTDEPLGREPHDAVALGHAAGDLLDLLAGLGPDLQRDGRLRREATAQESDSARPSAREERQGSGEAPALIHEQRGQGPVQLLVLRRTRQDPSPPRIAEERVEEDRPGVRGRHGQGEDPQAVAQRVGIDHQNPHRA
ncbi:MAG TPA: hypothetical protein VN493_12490 [Thermoanaerobaculia bacterium]|nr:hypothetical protein [Thermoanaerobaculia bacterium]